MGKNQLISLVTVLNHYFSHTVRSSLQWRYFSYLHSLLQFQISSQILNLSGLLCEVIFTSFFIEYIYQLVHSRDPKLRSFINASFACAQNFIYPSWRNTKLVFITLLPWMWDELWSNKTKEACRDAAKAAKSRSNCFAAYIKHYVKKVKQISPTKQKLSPYSESPNPTTQ